MAKREKHEKSHFLNNVSNDRKLETTPIFPCFLALETTRFLYCLHKAL